jgi:hypothetical protein
MDRLLSNTSYSNSGISNFTAPLRIAIIPNPPPVLQQNIQAQNARGSGDDDCPTNKR